MSFNSSVAHQGLKVLENARVAFEIGAASVNLSSQTSGHGELNVKFHQRRKLPIQLFA
jgi:hypothetical protein